MGSIFRYASDSAAKAVYEPPCDVCGDSESPCYRYCADDENDSAYMEIGACAACISGGKVRRHRVDLEEFSEVAGKHSANPAKLVDAYCRTPDLFRINGAADWPICCDDLCEYVGNPPDLEVTKQVPSEYQEWSYGPFGTEYCAPYELFAECVEEVLLFGCLACGKKYHISNNT